MTPAPPLPLLQPPGVIQGQISLYKQLPTGWAVGGAPAGSSLLSQVHSLASQHPGSRWLLAAEGMGTWSPNMPGGYKHTQVQMWRRKITPFFGLQQLFRVPTLPDKPWCGCSMGGESALLYTGQTHSEDVTALLRLWEATT